MIVQSLFFCELAKTRTQAVKMSAIFRFLDLPSELRDKILDYLVGRCGILGHLEDEGRCETITEACCFEDLIHDNCGEFVPRTTIAYCYEISILYTSRQLFNEASTIFYRENLFVKVVTNSSTLYRLLRECGVMRILKPLSEPCLPATISIDLIWYEGNEDGFSRTDPCPNLGLMIPCSELELLVLLLNKANLYKRHFLNGLQLIVRVANTFKRPEEVLEKGLCPLRKLDHIQDVRIQGDLRPVYIEELESAISRVVLTIDDVLPQIVDSLDRIRLDEDGHPQHDIEDNALWLRSILVDLATVLVTYPEFWTALWAPTTRLCVVIMYHLILTYMNLGYKDDALFYIEEGIEMTESGLLFVEDSNERIALIYLKAVILFFIGKRQESLEFFEKVVEVYQSELQSELYAENSRRAAYQSVIVWIQETVRDV